MLIKQSVNGEATKGIVKDEFEIFSVNHLPIIKKYADRLGIVETFNAMIPCQMEVEPGVIFLGMILDTLSGRSPLYRLESFFEHQDVELLLGKPVNSEHFADHNVARVMDKAYEAGTVKLFCAFSDRAVKEFDINSRHVSFDTTSVSVYGDYDLYNKDAENAPFKITNGYSKDHRPDLKQFLISLLCVDRNIPIVGRTEDGNGSDKTINNTVLSEISKHMARHGLKPGAFIYIGDSAVVTESNLDLIYINGTLVISRLPASYNECARVIKEAVIKDEWEDQGKLAITPTTDKRPAAYYKTQESEVILYGRKYRAVVVHSSAHDKRRLKKIQRELDKEKKEKEALKKSIEKKEFFCFADARKAADELSKDKSQYYSVTGKIIEKPKFKSGRPAENGIRAIKEMRYGIALKIEEKTDAIERLQKETGCFVLITNVPMNGEEGYDSRAILEAYKDQYGIEQNFGFMKNPKIVNSIFLKKAERIEVLGLVFLLSLLIWRLIERDLRQHVEKNDADLPGWDKRRTKRPTAFMLVTKFTGILILKIGNHRKLNKPLNSEQKEYLLALGLSAKDFGNPGAG